MPTTGRTRLGLDDLKGSKELAYDADAVALLRPLDAPRRRASKGCAMRSRIRLMTSCWCDTD
jgi:hypothetical protein